MPPFLLTLLAQGLNVLGNAVISKGKQAVEDKLGVKLDELTQTPEGLLKLKQLEVDHEEFLLTSILENRKVDLEQEKVELADTANARDSHTAIETSAEASWMAKNIVEILALIIVLGGGYMLATTSQADVRTAVVSIMTLVLGFFYGTTQSSRRKDATIAGLTAAANSGDSK